MVHGALEDARQDIRLFHAVLALIRQVAVNLLPGLPCQPGILLVIEAGGDNDPHATALRCLPDQTDVPAQIDGGAVHNGVDASSLRLFQLDHRHLQQPVLLAELPSQAHPHRPVTAGDRMLMDQGITQLAGVHQASNRWDFQKAFLLFSGAEPPSLCLPRSLSANPVFLRVPAPVVGAGTRKNGILQRIDEGNQII